MCRKCHSFYCSRDCSCTKRSLCDEFWSFVTGSLVVAVMTIILSVIANIWVHIATGHDADWLWGVTMTGITWLLPMGFVCFVKMLSEC